MAPPWALRTATRGGWFYLVRGRQCLFGPENGEPAVRVAAEDFVLVSQGHGHWLRDEAASLALPAETLPGSSRFRRADHPPAGNDETTTSLLCGCFCFEDLQGLSLSAAFPSFLLARGEGGRPREDIAHLLALAVQETAAQGASADAIMNRLVRILLIKLISGSLGDLPQNGANWLRALADPEIRRAIGLMHATPAEPWTVASLAERVAMSRSAFSARFTSLMGKPPVEYLTEWRMQRARWLLRTTRAEMKEVASQVGYESPAAFSRAFLRWAGRAPGAYRRESYAAADSQPMNMPLP
jgi:AraC-like DNA-binding protein